MSFWAFGDGSARLISFDPAAGGSDPVIPRHVEGQAGNYAVTEIVAHAFVDKALTSVVIPDSVTSVGYQAFQNNALTSVVIPDSVTTIGDWAFYANDLTSLDIPRSVTSVGKGAFGFNSLSSVNIPDSLATISDWVFRDNELLSISIPDSVTSIGAWAFKSNALTSVSIPSSVTSIGGGAFEDNALTSVVIPDSVTTLGSSAFALNDLTSVVIPNSLTTIANSAFHSNALTAVTIPATITNIEPHAFAENALTSVTIPESVTSLGWGAFRLNALTSVVIPDSIGVIDGGTFQHNSLTAVAIPSTVSYIGENAFSYNALTSVTIPDRVSHIGQYAFYTNELTSVVIPDSVTSVGDSAFATNALTSAVIPASVTSIGRGAFSGNKLLSVDLPDALTSIGDGAFSTNNLTSIVIPSSVTTIPKGAFSSNDLTSVTIPDSVVDIADQAFAYNALDSVVIPDSVSSIGKRAFESNHLTSVVIPDAITHVAEYAFANNDLTSIVMPNSVTTIDPHAFESNALAAVVIPDSVTIIDRYAFRNNPLTSVTLLGPPPYIEPATSPSASFLYGWGGRDTGLTMYYLPEFDATVYPNGYTSPSWAGYTAGVRFTTTNPTLTGRAQVGETLIASTTAWTPAPATTAYEWLADGKPIPGATELTYKIGATDLGKKLSFAVTGQREGHVTARATSAETESVAAGTITTGTVTIGSTAQVGQVLVATTHDWSPTPSAITYQWLANGEEIPNATDSTYEIDPEYLGKKLSVTATGTAPGYDEASSTSSETDAVAAGELSTDIPTLSAVTPTVGDTLTATPGNWSPGVTLTYQWLRNGTEIAGAESATYTAVEMDKGKTLAVAVTGTKLGYLSVTKTSAPTAAVASAPLPKTTPVFRFWSDAHQGHFYTASAAERDHIIKTYPSHIWKYERVAYQAFTTQQPGTVPLYRFWSSTLNGHFYTASASERDHVIRAYDDAVWAYERVAYYVYPSGSASAGTNEVYRFWSDSKMHHFYTASAAEKDHVIRTYAPSVWSYERVAFRVPGTARR
ncbi:leucine-rich repeat protein [Salinibacterium sp. GXW1014]|uniref:leucine-rich repeat protein n=1 Tax=Salinibacterium sp. GXW1014 TaxID=3377838 RepID=UPI00383A16DD